MLSGTEAALVVDPGLTPLLARELIEAHYRNIEKAIRRFGGGRVLITFGAGHKYWFLDQLKKRADVALLDLREYLP